MIPNNLHALSLLPPWEPEPGPFPNGVPHNYVNYRGNTVDLNHGGVAWEHAGGPQVVDIFRHNADQLVDSHSPAFKKRLNRLPPLAPAKTFLNNSAFQFFRQNSLDLGDAAFVVFDDEHQAFCRGNPRAPTITELEETILNRTLAHIKSAQFPCVAARTAVVGAKSSVFVVCPHPLGDARNAPILHANLRWFMLFQFTQLAIGNHYNTFVSLYPDEFPEGLKSSPQEQGLTVSFKFLKPEDQEEWGKELGAIKAEADSTSPPGDDSAAGLLDVIKELEPDLKTLRVGSEKAMDQLDSLREYDRGQPNMGIKRRYVVPVMHPLVSRETRQLPYPMLVFNAQVQFDAMFRTEEFKTMEGVIDKRNERIAGRRLARMTEGSIDLERPPTLINWELGRLYQIVNQFQWRTDLRLREEMFDTLDDLMFMSPFYVNILHDLVRAADCLDQAGIDKVNGYLKQFLFYASPPNQHGLLEAIAQGDRRLKRPSPEG